jgi:hypothetical protein
MKLTALSLVVTLFGFSSCVEPEKLEVKEGKSTRSHVDTPVGNANNSGIGVKNYLQINNTFAQMTGISSTATDIKNEYEKVYVQLPSTSNPASVSGFNQIATIRLAFAYCDKYVDTKYSALYQENKTEPKVQAVKMIDNFIDIDYVNNQNDKDFLSDVVGIINNSDAIVTGIITTTENNKKLLKLSCTSILSSSYVTMI